MRCRRAAFSVRALSQASGHCADLSPCTQRYLCHFSDRYLRWYVWGLGLDPPLSAGPPASPAAVGSSAGASLRAPLLCLARLYRCGPGPPLTPGGLVGEPPRAISQQCVRTRMLLPPAWQIFSVSASAPQRFRLSDSSSRLRGSFRLGLRLTGSVRTDDGTLPLITRKTYNPACKTWELRTNVPEPACLPVSCLPPFGDCSRAPGTSP